MVRNLLHKINSVSKKKLVALTLAAVLLCLPILAAANPDVRAYVAQTLGIAVDETVSESVEIAPLSGLDADGWPYPPVWTGTRIPAAYDTADSPVGRFNAVTGQVITSAPWDLDFSAFAPVEIPITTSGPAVATQARFRLNPNDNTAELYRLPMTVARLEGNQSVPTHALSSVVIPAQVTFGSNTYDVVSIGSRAAGIGNEVRYTGWATINMPQSITHIQAEAFMHSTSNSIFLPNNLTYLGDRAFSWQGNPFTGGGPSAARALTISAPMPAGGHRLFPDGLVEVGTSVYALRSITGGSNATLPESLEVVGVSRNFATNTDPDFPRYDYFGPMTFAQTVSFGTVSPSLIEFPSAWTQIPPGLFNVNHTRAAGVNGILLHNNITHVHANAFNNFWWTSAMGNISQFSWSDNLEYIGAGAFASISTRVFSGAAADAFLDFPPGIEVLGDEAFRNIAFAGSSQPPYLDLTRFSNLHTMGHGVFLGTMNPNNAGPNQWVWNENLTVIPNHWTVIPAFTFGNMYHANASNIILDLSATDIRYIGRGAFGIGVNPGSTGFANPQGAQGFGGLIPPSNLEWLGRDSFRDHTNMRGDLTFEEGLTFFGAGSIRNGGWDGTLTLPQSVNYFAHARATWNAIPFPMGRHWLGGNFSEIIHGRYSQPMVGSLPSVDDRFSGDVDASWESTLSISDADPILHKQARWTDLHLNEAEIMFQYGALIPWNLAFDLVFVLDYSHSMLDPVEGNWPTPAPGEHGPWVPRWLVQNFLLQDAIEIFLDNSDYDNRVAITTFEGGPGGRAANGNVASPPANNNPPTAVVEGNVRRAMTEGHLWSSAQGYPLATTGDHTSGPANPNPAFEDGFTDNLDAANQLLHQRPHVGGNFGNTNYGAGLSSAIDLIENRTDTSRAPVVIVIGDGEPWPALPSRQLVNESEGGGVVLQDVYREFNEFRAGVNQANELREAGVPVFPLGVFLGQGEGGGPNPQMRARQTLSNMAFDAVPATATTPAVPGSFWEADNTEEFVDALLEIVQDSVTIMPPTVITDYLSNYFELPPGAELVYNASAGTVAFDHATGRIDWDLTGADTGVLHTLTFNIHLLEEYHRTLGGTLPTNRETFDNRDDIHTYDSPELSREILNFVKTTEDGTTPLANAVFGVFPSDGAGGWASTPSQTATTIADGTLDLSFGGLRYGSQWKLRELQAPSPFITPAGYWIVTVGPDGGIASIVAQGSTQPLFTGGPANWTVVNNEDEPPPRPELDLTKILRTPEGTPIPNASFIFEFDPVRVRLSDDPLVYSRDVADFAALLGRYHTVPIDVLPVGNIPGTPPAVGIDYVTGTLDLGALLRALTFPGDGVFVWNIREYDESSGTSSPSYMDYSDARYQLRVRVEGGDIIVLEVFRFGYDEGETLTKQDDGPSFTNTYRRTTSLDVTKVIYAPDTAPDATTLFSFTLELVPHTLAALEFPIEAIIIDGAGNPVAAPRSPVSITGNSTTFELMHGESISIPSLPIGTVFNVTEAAHPNFAPSVTVTIGGSEVHTDERPRDSALPTGDHALGNGGNAADFVNAHETPVGAGLSVVVNNPIAATIVVAMLVTAASFAYKARKRVENMPVA